MDAESFTIIFENTSVGEANRQAEELRRCLLDADPDVQVEQRRDDETTMDFGATLVLVLGAPSVIAVSRAVANWLRRNNASSIQVQTPDGTVIAKNVRGEDVARIAEAFSPRRHHK